MARTETVTVLFTDLVGSTELAARLGHDAYETLRQTHFETLRRTLAGYNGAEIKTSSDGLMLCFAADAVACGVAMQQATERPGRQAQRPAAINLSSRPGRQAQRPAATNLSSLDSSSHGGAGVPACPICTQAWGDRGLT